jgi:GntR family transcriptional regulator/MocR family aminotransferase
VWCGEQGAIAMIDIFVHLERRNGQTLQQQLVEQMRAAIKNRRLPAGSRLPATRLLAAELGVSRNIVVAAFEELTSEGYLQGQVGSGTFVAPDLLGTPMPSDGPPAKPCPPTAPSAPEPRAVPGDGTHIDFLNLGTPDVAHLPLTVWRAMWREVMERLPPTGYGPHAGDPELRAAIAAHLGQARGVICGPEHIVITAGAAQALDLLLRLTFVPGAAAAVEDPGYEAARRTLLGRQARLVPIPVDADGLCVDRLPIGTDAPALVYVTPSHQYPLGVRLPVTRRMALLAWAEAHGSLIVEDDYDSEFRYDAPPLPALAGLDTTGRTAYIGTFSKVLAPALRVGYLVLPPPLYERMTRDSALRLELNLVPWPMQRALAQFITGGELERHIRRMRRLYAAKRAALAEALKPVHPLARLQGVDAGLHAYLDLAPSIDADTIVAHARARGVLTESIRPYYLDTPDRNGVLLGYGALDLADVAYGGRILAEAIAAAAS